MNPFKVTRLTGCMTAIALAAFAYATQAAADEPYPQKTVRIVVPFPPGQTVDVVGRIIADQLAASMGKAFIVENRSGASGTIGSALVAKAAPDGHMLLIVSNGTLAGNTALFKEKLPYDAVRDFAPIINYISTPQVLVADPKFPHKTLHELVKHAKANPGELSYATPGNGTSSHLAMEMLRAATGIDIVMVPYQGSPAALTDIMGGRIPIMFEAASGLMSHIRAGRVRPIVNGGIARASFLPDVPTVAESGYPGFDATPWVGMVAPAGTPRSIIDKLYAQASKGLKSSELSAKLLAMGAEPSGMDPDQFAAYIKAEIERWTKVVQAAGIKLQ